MPSVVALNGLDIFFLSVYAFVLSSKVDRVRWRAGMNQTLFSLV